MSCKYVWDFQAFLKPDDFYLKVLHGKLIQLGDYCPCPLLRNPANPNVSILVFCNTIHLNVTELSDILYIIFTSQYHYYYLLTDFRLQTMKMRRTIFTYM